MKKKRFVFLLPAAVALAAVGVASSQAQAQVVVVNAASSKTGYPVAPGGLVSAYGTFTGAVTEAASALPLPVMLGGAAVTVGGLSAPLLYVSASQINLQVPHAVLLGRSLEIVVNVEGTEVKGTLVTAETDPALFGLIVHHSDGSLNGPDNPANRGEAVVVYGSGIGPVDSTPADGSLPDGLSTGEKAVRAFFGGAEGAVYWSGLAPEFVGLWQLNLQVPAAPYVAGPLPLLVTLGGRPSSNQVTVYVEQ